MQFNVFCVHLFRVGKGLLSSRHEELGVNGPVLAVLEMLTKDASWHLHFALFCKALPRSVVLVINTPHSVVAILAVRMVLFDVSCNFRDLYLRSADFTVAGQVLTSLEVHVEGLALTRSLTVWAPNN